MAASAGGIKAGKAYVQLGIKDDLAAGLARAQRRLNAFAAGIGQLGKRMFALSSIGFAGLFAASKVFANTGSRLNDMSERTGLSAENLSELDFAAQQTGTSLEEIEAAVRRMNKTIGDGLAGDEAATKALQRLGLSAEQLSKLSTDERFSLIAARLREIPDPATKASVAVDILGRSAANLHPLIQEMERLKKIARELGITMTADDVKAADEFGDKLDALVFVAKRSISVFGSALVPQLSVVVKLLTSAAIATAKWLGQNKTLAGVLVTLAVVSAGVSLAMITFGGVLKLLSLTISITTTAIIAMKAAFLLLVSPIGLITVSLGALGAALLFNTKTGANAVGWLSKKFGILKTDALVAMKGITDAMATGDLGQAAKIAWLFVRTEWLTALDFLKRETQAFTLGIQDFFTNMAKNILLTWNGLEREWRLLKASFEPGSGVVHPLSPIGILEGLGFKFIPGKLRESAGLPPAGQMSPAEKEIEDDFEKRKNAIFKGAQVVKEEDKEASNKRAAAINKELQLARESLQIAQEEAAHARQVKLRPKAEDGGPEGSGGLPTPEELKGKFESVSGGFNKSFLAQSAGVGRAIDRTAKAAEETAKNTGVIAKGLPEMAGVFL